MVVVQKKSGNVRTCLCEIHPMPHVDDTLAGARIFSKLDANSRFWQTPLATSCRHLTTFITPFGCIWFNKLPFGISSAPEAFQKQMGKILEGLLGVLCHLDVASALRRIASVDQQKYLPSLMTWSRKIIEVFVNSHLLGLSVSPAERIFSKPLFSRRSCSSILAP